MTKDQKARLIVELLFELVEDDDVEINFSNHFGMVVDYLGTHSHVEPYGKGGRLESLLRILREIKRKNGVS